MLLCGALAMFLMHWSEHWANMTLYFRRGIEASYQSGDLLYLAYSAQDCVIWDPKSRDFKTALAQFEQIRADDPQDRFPPTLAEHCARH